MTDGLTVVNWSKSDKGSMLEGNCVGGGGGFVTFSVVP